MAISAATPMDRLRAGRGGEEGIRAPLDVTLVFTLTAAVAAFALLVSGVELVIHPKPLPPPFNLGRRQTAETALYLASFALVVPAALLLVPRLADAMAARPFAPALPALGALLAATLAGSILVSRVLPARSNVAVLVLVCAWSAAAAVALAVARRARGPGRLAAQGPVAWTIAGIAVLAALLAFTSIKSISPVAIALGAIAAVGVMAIDAGRLRLPRISLRRRSRRGLDAAVLLAVLLAVPDLVIFASPAGTTPFLTAFHTSVIQFHHDFVLGPANAVLHGRAMLVGTTSQYGVGSIYFLAGWFQLAPIGYGTLGFLDGVLFALFAAAAYSVLRMSGARQTLAVTAIALGVVVLIYNLQYSVGSLPAQHGPLRFGLPMLVILAAVLEARAPGRARRAQIAQFAVVGLASIWALEAFAYTTATFIALGAFRASTRREPERWKWLLRQGLGAALACVAAHVALSGATLIFAGQLPDYGRYLAILRSFLGGKVGDITYDFSRWSPALAVGVGYAASAITLVLVMRRRPDLIARERPAFVALCGFTAYGIVLFSYFVDRSADHIVPYVSLPALLAGTLWLSVLRRDSAADRPGARRGALAFALGLALLLTAVAWSSVGDRFSRSALGHLVPGGASARAALHQLWHPAPLDPRAPAGERLLARDLPPGRSALTLVAPDLETEILLRSGRVNVLPLVYPTEDSFASAQHLPALRAAVAQLRPGARLLTQDTALSDFRVLQTPAAHDPLTDPTPHPLAPLQRWVLQQIGRRFGLRVIERDATGLVVAALVVRP